MTSTTQVSKNGSQPSPPTVDANSADGKVQSVEVVARRVVDPEGLRFLLPAISHNEKLAGYCKAMLRDPMTFLLHVGERGCLVCSIVDHPLLNKTCIIAWGQNPDRYPVGIVRQALEMVARWAEAMQAEKIVALIAEEGPWDRIPAVQRLTGYRPFAMGLHKELV